MDKIVDRHFMILRGRYYPNDTYFNKVKAKCTLSIPVFDSYWSVFLSKTNVVIVTYL